MNYATKLHESKQKVIQEIRAIMKQDPSLSKRITKQTKVGIKQIVKDLLGRNITKSRFNKLTKLFLPHRYKTQTSRSIVSQAVASDSNWLLKQQQEGKQLIQELNKLKTYL